MDLKADSTIEPAKTLRKAPLLPTIGYCRVIEIQGERWIRKNLSGNQMKY